MRLQGREILYASGRNATSGVSRLLTKFGRENYQQAAAAH
jgi:hypothetical protein